jgi:Ca2+-binding EF-hand superfamily protein
LKQLYEKFDYDNDGKISFEDLKQSVGKVINPVAGAYFRAE